MLSDPKSFTKRILSDFKRILRRIHLQNLKAEIKTAMMAATLVAIGGFWFMDRIAPP